MGGETKGGVEVTLDDLEKRVSRMESQAYKLYELCGQVKREIASMKKEASL